ncbi:hypothetical protein POX_a00672 [Penicillium oxalicum]|uniref:hypothetical protein n=1 Tax=Penicillium oxalicum TaxID=69781 RepID=UPI0020B6B40C|nr:hypothetical protein POX_a00672 [Penicillium oxalicum]KAI2794082.1 hypothetical protein POX_a00672 [Penicillium oxalicum]
MTVVTFDYVVTAGHGPESSNCDEMDDTPNSTKSQAAEIVGAGTVLSGNISGPALSGCPTMMAIVLVSHSDASRLGAQCSWSVRPARRSWGMPAKGDYRGSAVKTTLPWTSTEDRASVTWILTEVTSRSIRSFESSAMSLNNIA